MKKFLSAIIVCFVMLCEIPGVMAFEYTPYIGDGIIRSTAVMLTDSDGNRVSSLVSGEEITASVRVSPGIDSLTGSEKVTLIVAAYSEGYLEYMNLDTETISSATELSASVTVPAKEPGIRVYIWDEVTNTINARPLFAMGEISDDNGTVEQITVGGETIEGFSADKYEYDVIVNAGYISWPEIIVYTGNTLTNVTAEYQGTFPLSSLDKQVVEADATPVGTSKTAVATITAGDKTYKINITQELPRITDVTLTYNNKATSVDEVWPEVKNIKVYTSYNVQNPKWTEELPGPNIETGVNMTDARKEKYYNFLLDSAVSGSSPAHAGGKYHYLYNLSPELVGAHQITIERVSTSSGPNIASEGDDYLSFTINRSARIYAYVGSSASALSSSDGWINVNNEIYSSSENAVRGAYARYMGSSATAYTSYLIAPMRYLDVKVTPGETKTVTIPKGRAIGYTFIKFDECSDIVSNPSYKYGTTTANTKVSKLFTPLLRDNTLTGTDLYKKYTSASSDESTLYTNDVPAEGTGNLLYGTSVFSNAAAYVPVSFASKLEGSNVIRLRTKMADLQYIQFDLSGSAKVYILTNITDSDDFADLKSCLNTDGGWNIMGDGEDSLITFYNGGTGNEYSCVLAEKTSFIKNYYVDDGDTTTVKLDFSGMDFPDGKVLMVLVQPIK